MNSIKKTTRVAGVLYLIIFIASPLAFLIGKGGLLVPGDATATANNIMASETLFRAGIASETVVFLVEIVLAAIFYVLLKPVSPALSLAAAFARLAEAVVQAVNLIPSILIFLITSGSGYLTVFEPDQLDALVLLLLNAYDYVTLVWGFFFGLNLVLLGILVYKSGYFPKILGILLALASFGYLIQSYGVFLVPQYKQLLDTIVMVLAVPGELVFTVYLLWKGINVEKWEKRELAYA
jgi:Domain of unknown function (DUF4386)